MQTTARTVRIAFLLAIIFFTTNLSAQSYEWTHHFGGSLMDYCDAIVTDSEGNIYATGFYRGDGFTIEGEVLPWVDSVDSFLAKFNRDGELLWVIPFWGAGVFDRTEALVLDNEENIMVLSTIQDTFMIGNQLTIEQPVENNIDIILMKLDPDGGLMWHKTFGGPATDLGYRMVKHEDDIFMVGHFVSDLILDGITLSSLGGQDMFICKLDLDGNVIWGKRYGSEMSDRLYNIDFYSDGGFAVCGYSTGGWEFGSTELDTFGNSFHGFWGKLNSDGDPIWAKQIINTGNMNGHIYDLAIDDEDNTCIITSLAKTNTVDGILIDAADGSTFAMINYDENGSLDWFKVDESKSEMPSSFGNSINFHNHNYWVAGGVGPGIHLLGQSFGDVSSATFYVAAVNTDGDLIADFYESSADANSSARDLAFDGTSVVTPLWVIGDATINGESISTQDRDIVLAKIDFSGLVDVDEPTVLATNLKLSPNPAADFLTIDSDHQEIQSFQILDAEGKLLMSQGLSLDPAISIAHLPSGKYFVRLNYGNGVAVKSFVKI